MARAGKHKTVQATDADLRARLARASGHLELARNGEGSQDRNAVASAHILAAIAAADVICGKLTGEYNRSTDHSEAVRLLTRAGEKESANDLNRILRQKNIAQYAGTLLSEADAKQVGRLAEKLVARAQELLA